MWSFLKNFRSEEDGAVTVDWVVITAAIVALAILLLYQLSADTEAAGAIVATNISSLQTP